MRCFRKSIRSFAERAACTALAIVCLQGHADAAVCPSMEGIQRALTEAIHLRMGRSADVSVTVLAAACVPGMSQTNVSATPDVGIRAGVPARFALFAGSRARRVRVGEATATAHVSVEGVRTTQSIARGDAFSASNSEAITLPLDGRPLMPLPTFPTVTRARARRGLEPGTILTGADVEVEPAIRSGQRVRAIVRASGIEVSTVAVATQSAAVAEVIALVNPESRRTLHGRVVGEGEVEVVDVR